MKKLTPAQVKALAKLAEVKTMITGSYGGSMVPSLRALVKRGLVDLVRGKNKPQAYYTNGFTYKMGGKERTVEAGWCVSYSDFYRINHLGHEALAATK